MSMSVAYAMMSAGDISIRSEENIRRCLELKTDRFGTGHVYYKVYAVTSLSRSFRFDQVEVTYADRKVMKHLVDSGQGELITHKSDGLLIYIWRDEYNNIVAHNEHNDYRFVVLDTPPYEVYGEYGAITEDDTKSFYGC